MAGIIAFPHVVQQALQDFGDLFANEPQRRHFAEYLTGLYVADRKTVSGINAPFANSRDPSGLNRRKLQYKGRIVKASELAAQIEPSLRKSLREGQKEQWYFTCSLRIPDIDAASKRSLKPSSTCPFPWAASATWKSK